jgi:hypothetical protein
LAGHHAGRKPLLMAALPTHRYEDRNLERDPVMTHKSATSPRIFRTAIAAIALLGFTSFAHAGTYARHGEWSNYAVYDLSGTAVCGAQINGDAGREFHVKAGANQIYLQLHKTSWHFADNTPVTLHVQVDNAPELELTATGINNGTRSYINFAFDPNGVDSTNGSNFMLEFLNLLTTGNRIKFWFPDGNEDGWNGSLSGSDASMADLTNCIKTRLISASQPTAQPTQPTR